MAVDNQGPGPASLAQALEDHSAAGVQLLYSEPAPLLRYSLALISALLLSLFAWSFVGKADVIVSAPGVLSPEDDVRRVYSPGEGELEGLLVREGDPVQAGAPLARVRSRNAIALAAEAQQAALALAGLELEEAQFPATLALLEQEAELLQSDLEAKQEQLDRRLVSGSSELRREQLARLKQARGAVAKARNERDRTNRQYRSYRELSGSAVSEVEAEDARIAYEQAASQFQQAAANLRALESQFIREAANNRTELAAAQVEIEQLRIAQGRKRIEIEQAPRELEVRLAAARAKAESSRQIRFEEGIGNNVLVILAPTDGVITNINATQTGDSVSPSTPLLNIAPKGSRKVLRVLIAERDRGFLNEGSEVKMKFNAFPYQQHGFVEGTLEYVSPTTQNGEQQSAPAYRGFVSLDRDHFMVRERRQEIRYGMTAVAEIVVRKRRMIDMLLDSIRPQ
ncbi:MAG: HlyD family efflux transporter periplasmic adaptor subunit [Pseudomonadales bacterium]